MREKTFFIDCSGVTLKGHNQTFTLKFSYIYQIINSIFDYNMIARLYNYFGILWNEFHKAHSKYVTQRINFKLKGKENLL